MKSVALTLVIVWLLGALIGHSFAEQVLYQQEIQLGPEAIPIRALVGGQNVLLGLDTGVTTEVVETALCPPNAHRLADININTSGREGVVSQIQMPGIQLGDWTLPPSDALVSDCARFRNNTGVAYRGYLGVAPLKKTVIDINFDERRLRILRDMQAPEDARPYSAESASDGLWYLPLTIASDDPRPKLDVIIDNVWTKLLIDTGSGASITLRHETFEKMVESGAIERTGKTGKIAVGTGFVDEQSGRFTRGSFLGYPLKGWRVNDGVTTNSVGMRLLMNWNFMIDLQDKRFYFSRGKSGSIEPFACLGLSWQYDDDHACYVRWVNSIGEAAKSPEIHVGDRILKLGPLSAADINVFSLYEFCLKNAGQPITVEFLHPRDKQSITKPLTRYLLLHQ